MSAMQLLLCSGVLAYEVVPFLLDCFDSREDVEYVVSLRLVCKDWNDGFVNASDFWHQFMIQNLEKTMKARGNDEKIEIEFPIINDKNSFMLNCIRNSFLARNTIKNLHSDLTDLYLSDDYTMVTEPAILNEFNDELISEMIRLVSPFIFIEKLNVSTGGHLEADFEITFTIPNIQQTSNQLTKLLFTIYRCDCGTPNGTLLRSNKVTMNEGTLLVETEIVELPPIPACDFKKIEELNYNARVTKSDKEVIKEVMEKIGLSREMIDSEACVREFLYMIYHKGFEKVYLLATCERELFEIDEANFKKN